jgi:ribA/ribD-fused uncharacterized protein
MDDIERGYYYDAVPTHRDVIPKYQEVHKCRYCRQVWYPGDNEMHTANCPVILARQSGKLQDGIISGIVHRGIGDDVTPEQAKQILDKFNTAYQELTASIQQLALSFDKFTNVYQEMDMEKITSFTGEQEFLSNFFPVTIQVGWRTFPTVEHAFQAAKAVDDQDRHKIQHADTPGKAKRLGRKIAIRPDWDQVKVDVMRDLLRQKFSKPDLGKLLLSTGDAILIEGNKWGDEFWGATEKHGEWYGENMLGKLLMEIREELREENES